MAPRSEGSKKRSSAAKRSSSDPGKGRGREGASDERRATTLDRQIGARVRAQRLAVGMSQERLAALLGVTFQQVQKYEKGVNRIAASRLFAIAGALGVNVCEFYGGASAGANTLVTDVLSTPEGAQLVKVFASINSPKVRRNVVALVSALADEDKRS